MLTILHLDMDAFFAAVEQRDNPALRGKPVVVGSPPDRRGVVSTASYEARRFGIHSAMPSRTAYSRCPDAIFVPVRMKRYAEVSRAVMEILRRTAPLVEQVSVDEAFLDVRGVLHHWPDAVAIGRHLQQCIRDELGLTASVGVAPNKFLAKLASDLQKPDGLTVTPVAAVEIRQFLAPLSVTRIWGVGKVTAEKLGRLNIRTIGDLQALDLNTLTRYLGETFARHLLRLANGIDDRTVVTEHEEKSISHEETFDEDCEDAGVIRQTLIELTENVGRRLRAGGKVARTGQLKLRLADFTTLTRQQAFPASTASDRDLLACALSLLDRLQVREPVRLIGFGVANLGPVDEAESQPFLFAADHLDPAATQNRELDRAVDGLRGAYGRNILRRGNWTRKGTTG